MGDRSGYKNFYLFINAFKEISIRNPDINVILTGGGKLGISDLEFIARLNLQEKIRHINVTDEELNFLYQQALFFVYPSLHEGFGLPILEAFKACCPMILSDTDCFKEIAEDAAIYFNAYQKDSLVDVLEKMINSSTLRDDLIKKGQNRLKEFSLDKSMKATLDIYKSIV